MAKPQSNRNTNGIVLMLINAFATSMLYCIMKFLTGFINSHQVVFFYKLIVLVGLIPWILYDGVSCIKTKKLKIHLLRGFVSTAGALCFMYGMSKVDIASATALNKMEPILLMLVSALYFKEKLTSSKLFVITFSCVGMLFVVFPLIEYSNGSFRFPWFDNSGNSEFNYNYLIILLGVFLWTINTSVVKILGRTESNRTQLFYVSLISVFVAGPIALCKWEYLNGSNIIIPTALDLSFTDNLTMPAIGMLLCLGMLHFIHVACNFQSLKIAEMSIVAPFDYSKLVFGGMLGFFFFGNIPTLSALLGYLLIIGSGVYLLKTTSRSKN